jgi:hypothetical protein
MRAAQSAVESEPVKKRFHDLSTVAPMPMSTRRKCCSNW